MRNMYDRYRLRYLSAIENLPKISQDEGYMDIVCFDTQQSLEFLIKHILNVKNVPYRKTHNISELLSLLFNAGFHFDKESDAILLADTITSWETGSRYGAGVYTTENVIRQVFSIIDSINTSYKEDIARMRSFD